MTRKKSKKRIRETTGALLDRARELLDDLDPSDRDEIRERIEVLHAFEGQVLEERILSRTIASRSRLATTAGLAGSQAAQLERRMIVRVLGVLHNRRATP